MEREILDEIAELLNTKLPKGSMIPMHKTILVALVQEVVEKATKYDKVRELLS